MKLGVAVGPDPEAVEEVPQNFDFVELAIGEMEVDPEEIDMEKLGSVLDRKDLELILHLPFRQPFVTSSETFNEAVIEDWRRLLQQFSEFEPGKAVIHFNFRHGEEKENVEKHLEKQVERLQQLSEETGVELCLENVGQFPGLELFELGALLEKLDASMCFDTGHAFAEVGQDEMEEFLEKYSHTVSHIHVQDTREDEDLHIAVGEGQIDFEAVARELEGFDGTACLEIYTSDPDYIQLSREKFLQHF